MAEEILGSIYYKASEAFQRGISPLARGIKAETHDLAVVTVEGTPKVKQLGNILPTSTRDNPNQGRVYDTSGLSPGITDVSKGGGREPMIVENITSCSFHENNFLSAQYRIRKLTPLECWRLMGFSDRDFRKAAAVNSNSQLYKQAGNSIVKNVLTAIFAQLIETEV